MNNRTFPLLALTALLASQAALAGDNGAIVGAAVGGAVGAAIGQQTGGKDGAVIGGAIGGATGAAIGSNHKPAQSTTRTVVVHDQVPQKTVVYVRDGRDRDYWDDDHHDNGRHRGHHKHHHHHDRDHDRD